MNNLPAFRPACGQSPQHRSTTQTASQSQCYLDSLTRRGNVHAVLTLLVARASGHELLSMKDALAAAGNKSLLYQVIFSLRDEFGRDAVTAHINRGYELKLAAAERIAVLLDTPDLAERIALAGAKRRNEGKLATAAVVQEGPLVPAKRQRLAAEAMTAADHRMNAGRFLDDVFTCDASGT